MRAKSSRYTHFLLAALGLALVTIFVARIGVAPIASQLAQLGPSVAWLLLPYAIGTGITALPWGWLLPQSVRPRLTELIASRFAASGSNALLPFFGVAGEPLRLMWLPNRARPRGLAAVVVDRALYNSASALLLLAAAVASLDTRLPRGFSLAMAAVGLVMLLVTLGAMWLVARVGVGRRLSRLLKKVLGEKYANPRFGAEVDAALVTLLAHHRPVMWRVLWMHFAGRSVMAVETYVALHALHASSSVPEALVLATAPIASSLIASSIPSQLGVQEGVLALASSALGLGPAVGMALGLLWRLRQLIFVPLAPLLTSLAPVSANLTDPFDVSE